MHCVLNDPNSTDGPTGARPSGSITAPPAVAEPKIRKLHFTPFPAAAVGGHSLNALEFHTAEPSGQAMPKTSTR